MKKIYTLSVLFLSLSCFSQNVKSKVDMITGDTILYTSLEKLYSKVSFGGTPGEQLKAAAGKTKVGILLSFWIQTGKTSIFSFDQDASISIKLQDGTVISEKLQSDKISNYTSVGYGSKSYVHLLLSPENVIALKSGRVAAVRIPSSRGNFDYEIKGKFSEVVADLLKAVDP